MWNGKWAVRLLECDVATGMWRGETVQVVWWLLLVWNGKWAVRLLERDVVTGGGGEKQYGQYSCNETMKRFRVTIIAVEKQKC